MEQQLIQEQKKPNMLAFQVAIIYTFFHFVFVVVMRMLNINLQSPDTPTYLIVILSIITWGLFIFAIFYTQNKHKKELGGFITFGRAFSAGFKTAVYAGLFTSILLFVYYQFIDPGAVDEMMDVAVKRAKNEQEVQGIQMMAKYMGVISAFSAGMIFAFCGLIISLISAAIVKKERPMYVDDTNYGSKI